MTTHLRNGQTFGPFNRYKLHRHESDRPGVESSWMVLDAETPDDLTGAPGVIRQAETIETATRGLETEEPCAHRSTIPANGHGAFCEFCGEVLA